MSQLLNFLGAKDAGWRIFIRLGLIFVLFAPLIIYNEAYFPFIFPRNMYFRLIIELLFFAYLWLVLKNTYQWPKFNKGFIFFGLFILTLTIASIFGGNFLFSFWSTFERMDGLVNWYHLLLYVIVLLGVNRTEKDWQILFRTSLVVAVLVALYALGQALGASFLLSSAGGQRLSSTLGNAAYVGSYLFLHIVLTAYFLFKKISHKHWYSWSALLDILAIILFVIVLLATETRGALLGLLSFAFLLTLAYLYYERQKKNKFYYLVAGLLLASIVFLVTIFIQKDSAWVRSVPIFSRLANISLTDTTTQSRLLIWKNSLTHAFVAKPIFGWGEENFADAFNQYFPSAIFVSNGSEIWFDRPHNILIQHLVHGGIIGLGFYLAIFVYLLGVFWQRIRQGQFWLWPVFWSAFLLGFLVQDFFIFDNLNVNVVFYLILAYLFYQTTAASHEGLGSRWRAHFQAWQARLLLHRFNLTLRGIILILLALVFCHFMVLKPWRSNTIFVSTFLAARQAQTAEDFENIKNDWLRSYYMLPLGDKEKVAALNDLLGIIINNPQATSDIKFDFIRFTGQHLEANYEKYPLDIRSGMFLSNFYQFVGTFDPSFVDRDITLLENMAKLAPWRLEIKFALQEAYQKKGDFDQARKQVLAATALSPKSPDVQWHLVEFYWLSKDYQAFTQAIEQVRDLNRQRNGFDFSGAQISSLKNYSQQAKEFKQVELAAELEKFLAK